MILTFSCKEEIPASLEVTPSELNWEWNDTEPQTVTVTANYDWTAEVSDAANWTLIPANDGKTFTVAPKAINEAVNAPLKATVTITCRDAVKTMKLTQGDAPAATLDVSATELNWEWNDTEPQTVTVTAN